jgi:hypothetical protein
MYCSLVTISPQYVAGLFRYGENELVPAKAKLRPEEGQNGCQPSAFQTFLFKDSDAATDVDSKVTVNDIFVDFRGSSTQYHGAYIGKELYDHGDNAAHSAWVYIFQTTMLGSARSDAEAGRKWKDTDSDGLVQEFNGILPQDYTNLGHMLKLVTGQEAAQEKISDLMDDDLEKIMDAAHKSPVLIIPKATSNGRLDGGRIWIGWTKAPNYADKWTLFNPIEKKKGKGEYTLAEIKELGETIVFLSDHSPLED